MTYNYLVTISFGKGNEKTIIEYKRNFLSIGKLFVFLENKHKNNYTLISIKSLK